MSVYVGSCQEHTPSLMLRFMTMVVVTQNLQKRVGTYKVQLCNAKPLTCDPLPKSAVQFGGLYGWDNLGARAVRTCSGAPPANTFWDSWDGLISSEWTYDQLWKGGLDIRALGGAPECVWFGRVWYSIISHSIEPPILDSNTPVV